MRILVTGAAGFLGSHLFERLKRSECDEIIPVTRNGSGRTYACDLCRQDQVLALLDKTKPSRIFHCAGSYTNDFEHDYQSNVLTAYHLLWSIGELSLSCRILLVGSAAEYGIPQTASGVVSEDHPLVPVSVYGLSKAWQTQLMGYFTRKHGTDVVMARIFNLDGEGASASLFPGHVRSEVRAFLARETEIIKVGDLSALRDYLDVDMAVSDLIAIMDHGQTGEAYNVGSGHPVKMKEFLRNILEAHNLAMDVVEVDANMDTQSADVSVMAADLSKIQKLKAGFEFPETSP